MSRYYQFFEEALVSSHSRARHENLGRQTFLYW